MRRLPFLRLVCAFAPVLAASTAAAAPVETVAGVELARGPGARVTRSAFAGAGVALGARAAFALAIAGGDDSQLGRTSALVGGLVLAPSATARLRLRAVRSLDPGLGDGFVRLLAGPEFGAADGTRLGLLYVLESSDGGGRSDGARAELAVPLSPRWTARGNAAWATVPGAPAALAATAGASFSPVRRLEIVGEMGLARGHAPAAAGSVPSSPGPLGRFLGDPPPEASGATTGATPIALAGLRVTLP